MLLALVGAVASVVVRRRAGVALAVMAVGIACAFVVWPSGTMWNGRLLPMWYLSVYLLAAIGVADVVRELGRRTTMSKRWKALAKQRKRNRMPLVEPVAVGALAAPLLGVVAMLVAVAAPVGAVPLIHGSDPHVAPNLVADWARYDLGGYPAAPSGGEYRAVVDAMDTIGRQRGCGRAYADIGGQDTLARYGSQWAMMVLPYWTHHCITSLGGVYLESSATAPYAEMIDAELSGGELNPRRVLPYQRFDVAVGARRLRVLGVRYYLAISPAAKQAADNDPELLRLIQSGPWNIYEIRGGGEPVVALADSPVVVSGVSSSKSDWLSLGLQTYLAAATAPTTGGAVPVLTTHGPATWPRIAGHHQSAVTADQQLRLDPIPNVPLAPVVITHVRQTAASVSFDVDRVGIPVLIDTSYFPNWHASGARGPWRATPNFMVVVPTQTHVALHYGWTPPELAGWLLTLLGLFAAAALVSADRRRARA
ncbi:MAG: hypothetical protein ACYDD7_25145 [Acidimicrobiales bacterium]